MKGEIEKSKIIVRTFNIPFLIIKRIIREKILLAKKMSLHLRDISRIFYTTEYTFFSCAQGIFSDVEHMLSIKLFQ